MASKEKLAPGMFTGPPLHNLKDSRITSGAEQRFFAFGGHATWRRSISPGKPSHKRRNWVQAYSQDPAGQAMLSAVGACHGTPDPAIPLKHLLCCCSVRICHSTGDAFKTAGGFTLPLSELPPCLYPGYSALLTACWCLADPQGMSPTSHLAFRSLQW